MDEKQQNEWLDLFDLGLNQQVVSAGGERVGVRDRYLHLCLQECFKCKSMERTRLQRLLQRQRIMQVSWVEQGRREVAWSVSLRATHG